jgi:hypothetical protein
MNHKSYLRHLHEIMHMKETLLRSRKKPNAFTRKRSMGFIDALCFQLDMRKTAIQTRLNVYFTQKGGDPISQQAYTKLRANFDHSPFETMLRQTVAAQYENPAELPKYKGLHVFAVDGSTVQLPRTDEMREEFGTRGKGHICPCAGISALFDVLSSWAVDPDFDKANRNERDSCEKHIDFFSKELPHIANESVILMDRGYPSHTILKKLHKIGAKYLIRCSTVSFAKAVGAPMGSSVISLQEKKIDIPLCVRVFKFALPSGEVEILITNLMDFDEDSLKELYSMRWRIETMYHKLKRELCVENFSGKTPNSVRQDFWASMVLLNAVAVFQADADQVIAERQKPLPVKHLNRARTSNLIITLRDKFVFSSLSLAPDFLETTDDIIKIMARSLSPVRPDRHFPRPVRPFHKDVNLNLKSHL